MRGKVFSLFDKGVKLEWPDLIGEGDFNLLPGPANTGAAENEGIFTMPGRGVVARLYDARVRTVAGYGLKVAGIQDIVGKSGMSGFRQEWWFVPAGHEDPGSDLGR